MRHLVLILLIIALSHEIKAQKIGLSVGTDIPYQFYTGISVQSDQIDVSYRTGLLISPYSDILIDIIKYFGVKEIYTNLLESSYQFGWMNGLNVAYKIGEQKKWYLGPELRFDYLTAADASIDIIEAVTGKQISFIFGNQLTAQLGVNLYSAGLRFGREISLGADNRQSIRIEFSASKQFATKSTLHINSIESDELNNIINNLLWEDVFKKYGYVGGIGISYCYTF